MEQSVTCLKMRNVEHFHKSHLSIGFIHAGIVIKITIKNVNTNLVIGEESVNEG